MSSSPLRPVRHWSHRIPLLGPVALTRPRWSLAVLVGVLAYAALAQFRAPVRLIAAWDTASLFFVISVVALALRASPQACRRRAKLMDQGAMIVLLLTLCGVVACLLTIITAAEDLKLFAGSKGAAAAVVAVTVVLTWLVTQCTFTLHYAHLYYGDREGGDEHVGGLDFPGKALPDYFDFAYFAFVLGMTFQVSDVQITDRGLRRLALLHGLVSFFFTTVILALTINMLAGLAQP